MILHDIHKADCTCSYCCGRYRLRLGLNIPKDWAAPNSWYVVQYWPKRYIRCTIAWPKFARRLRKA